jgi:hypothetical protein
MTDIEQGREALRFFHNASVGYAAYSPTSLDELAELYGKKRDIYLDGIGMVIRETGLSTYKVQDAMIALAKRSQGKIPRDHQGYINALGNKASEVSYLDLSKTVAANVAAQVVDGTVSVGNSVIKTGTWFFNLLPILFIGGVVFYIFSFGKNNSTISTEAIKRAKDKVKKTSAAVKAKIKAKVS